MYIGLLYALWAVAPEININLCYSKLMKEQAPDKHPQCKRNQNMTSILFDPKLKTCGLITQN